MLAGAVRGPGIRPAVRPVLTVLDDALLRWSATNVRPQKQDGFAIVTVTAPLGDVTGEQLRVLAELAAAYGDGTIRTTLEQNLVLRWIRRSDVAALYRSLAAVGLDQGGANTSADVTSCPGAEACRLAVTQSRGLGRLLADHLAARPDLVAAGPRPQAEDQRLPERLRPAPRRRPRLPGQRAQGGGQGAAPVLRDARGRGREGRRPLRADRGQGPRAPDPRGGRAPHRPLRQGAATRRSRRGVLPARRRRSREPDCWATSRSSRPRTRSRRTSWTWPRSTSSWSRPWAESAAPDPHLSRACGPEERCMRVRLDAGKRRSATTLGVKPILFNRGIPAAESFGIDNVLRAARDVLGEHGNALMQYGPSTGFAPLREWLAAWQGVTRGSGAAGQRLAAAPRLPVPRPSASPATCVFTEAPTYDRTLTLLRRHGAQVVGIPLAARRARPGPPRSRDRQGAAQDSSTRSPTSRTPRGPPARARSAAASPSSPSGTTS